MRTIDFQELRKGNFRMLARAVSLVENRGADYEQLLEEVSNLQPDRPVQTIGITGPPGAGKSTLIDKLLAILVTQGKKVAVLAVDPSSPFHHGALLGDRLRMPSQYTHPEVFIRSLASRGSLGGLHPRIIEISTLIQVAGFDHLIIETVGVGQSEVEIAGLADTTAVILAPESGDDIQSMKAGLMEIADIFILNKADRPLADKAARYLREMVRQKGKTDWNTPVIKTIATDGTGIPQVAEALTRHSGYFYLNQSRKAALLTEKVWQLIASGRMRDLDPSILQKEIENQLKTGTFNLYRFIKTKR